MAKGNLSQKKDVKKPAKGKIMMESKREMKREMGKHCK